MLTTSAAFAEARRLSRSALGGVRLDPRLSFVDVLQLYEAQIAAVSSHRYEVDIDASSLQCGRLSDVELWYSRFQRQFIVYWDLHRSQRDPAWTAVTGYYSAFHGAQTLLSMLGEGARSLPAMANLHQGLYRLTSSLSQYPDRIVLELKVQGGGGSHRALWTQLESLLNRLASVPTGDSGSILTIKSLAAVVIGPPSLEKVRNEINYSIDYSAQDMGSWRSEIAAVSSADDLEERLQKTSPVHRAQRFELIALSMASLCRALYSDYLDGSNSPDLRPSRGRATELTGLGADHAARVWFEL